MRYLLACLIFVFSGSLQAQFARTWQKVPSVAVIGAPDDPRQGLVDEAISYWNGVFGEIGSPFRLGTVTRVAQPVPEVALQALSAAGPLRSRDFAPPPELRELPADLNIFLAQTAFVSFTGPFDQNDRRLIGIRTAANSPLSLPNVMRNLIAHEIGHAIGLGHNSDPAMLMCGRPAPCRPDAFESQEARMFPLTQSERGRLLQFYPPQWAK